MDTKMDTKNLKHRKRQKKSKSGIDKRNNDVLVVPPDILKKLGISIGNTNFIHEITNNNNAGQNISIINNEATASIPMPINNKNSNESSILETANLMKKSVFLSPTFVSTVNNVIPGQVEISKIKNYDSCETDRENLPFEMPEQLTQKGRKNKNKNDLLSNGYINGDISGMSVINNTGNLDKNNCVFEDPKKPRTITEKDGNIKDIATKINCNNLTINRTGPPDLKRIDELSITSLGVNSFLTKDDIEAANNLNSIKKNTITNGQSERDNISLKGSELYNEKAKPKNDFNSVDELAVLIKQTDMEIEGNESRIIPAAENNLISLEKSTVQIENLEAANNLISLEGLEIKIGQREDENNLIELEGLAMQVDQEEFQNNLISLEGCDIQLELPEDDNTLISLEKSAIEIEKAEVDNIVYFEDCEINVEDNNKLVSIENSVIQIEAVVNNNLMYETDNLITLAELAVQIEKGEVDNNWGSLDGCKMKIGKIENENKLISLNELGGEIEKAEVDNIEISLEQTGIQRDEVDSVNIKTLEEGHLQVEPVEEENNSHHSTAYIEQAHVENNINIILIDQGSPNNDSMEANLEIVCEDLKEISSKDYKDIFTEKGANVDSDITVNGQDITFKNFNEHMSQISEGDIVIQMQESEIEDEKTDNNNIVLNDCKNTENSCDGFSKDSSILNDKSLESTRNINDHDNMIPLNKAIQKVNIISEEIIPASDLKELKRSNSPIIKSLTPVPLNTIIAPKKAETRIGKSKRKAAPKLVLPSEKVSTTLQVITSNSDIKDQKCEESIENVLNIKPLNKVNLKNNNDSFGCADNQVTTNEQGIENKSSTTDHSRLIDLHKSENEPKLCEDNKINDVSHLNGSPLEHDCVKDSNCIDNKQKLESPLDTKGDSDDNISKENSISNPESESEQNKKQVIEKKRKKNKKGAESKNIVVNTSEDKAFCDTQINNILKSAKDSDTNAHLDKVKEIAEYIKKYAHVYKDNKKGISKNINKETNNIKDNINSKTNMIKSKLCIQGVEKPGGNKIEKELPGNKVLKTYTRQRKQQKLSSIPTVDKNDTVTCNIVDANETELNIVDISTSYKTQDFCLCYDFGRLDACDNDNSYEHIHFWLHNDNTDLESILSIYNDDVEPVDRTKLDDLKISEVVEDDARIDNICWNYFLNYKGDGSKDVENSNRIQAIDECIKEKSNKDVATNNVVFENSDSVSKMAVEADDSVEQCNINNKIDDTDTASDVNMLKDVDDVNVQSGSDVYDIITVVEVVDGENEDILETAESNSALNTATEETMSNKNDTSKHIKQAPQETQKEYTKMDTPKEVKKNKKVTLKTDNKKDDSSENNKTETDNQTTSKTNRESKEMAATSEPESSKQSNRKRKLPNDTSEEPPVKKDVKCGVCDKVLPQDKWEHHVVHKHGFIAWKVGQSFNFEDPSLIKKLQRKIEMTGSLRCATCSLQTTKFKKYISHVKVCSQHKASRRGSTSRNLVKCGVCHQDVSYLSWNEHIGKEHNYLAWIEGQEVLNIANESAVSKHLQTILKANGGLTCYKCGLNRKRVKVYLSHVENCDGTQVNLDESSMSVEASIQEDNEPLSLLSARQDKKTVTCGVCKGEVPVVNWTEHIAKEHNYLAWEDGGTPLNVDDEEAVWNHLQEFIRQSGGLMCYKCGLNRKRVKMYLSHIKTCDGQGVNLNASIVEDVSINEETDEKTFECGVCHAKVTVLQWNEHIGREHNYLAWKVGATPLDVNNEDAVKEHLRDIIRSCDGLICYKCGLNRRRVKLYQAHIETCDGTSRQDVWPTSSNSMIEITIDGPINIVKCGVCDQNVAESLWFEHIGREHKYLAWEHGQEPLDLEDEDAVKEHLLYVSRQNNGLICNMCQVTKKYPKVFLQHVKECTGLPVLEESLKIEPESIFDVSHVTAATVKCGVCHNDVKTDQWMTHMEVEHDYLAWLDGKDPLDLQDATVVQKHLIEVSKKTGGLKCKKCGLVRKYAKSYLQHTEACWSGLSGRDLPLVNGDRADGTVECAVCHTVVDSRDWREHAMKKHYNVAWVVGGTPIEINNPYGVEPCIKEYQARHNNKLVCKTCGIHRVSAVGFYAHIITCGKTEEEQEIYKNLCEICNNKYLRIYKSQHMTMHREKEHAIERKILMAKAKELKKEENEPVEVVGGRRKAAEKAKTVIEKYTSKIIDGSHCSRCGFTSDKEEEMKGHVCVEEMFSDSDESVDLAHCSEEDDDTDVDSNISEEEREARNQEMTRSRRHGDGSARIQRLPYQIRNLNTYMSKSAEEFIALHLTDEDLFPDWRYLEYETVPEEELPRYMPPLEESCKVRHGDVDTWQTYKRFEAKKERDVTTMFTGACIQCICWVPPYTGQYDVGPVREYLSVVTHLSADVPRHHWQDRPGEEPALVQIWDCGNLVSDVPELAMGVSVECGTIWSMDWCPSGARDVFDPEGLTTETYRLGLFAAACSNGSAYVFAVPHPSTIKHKDEKFYKLTPVAELRLATCSSRKTYQATAIKWSAQKGHAHIVVGYADGTTAYFDLKNESPMLKSKEKNVTVFYPYHDERSQSMCIEDVDVFPTRSSRVPGVVAAGSVGGAGAWHAQAHAAAARVLYPPHWPAALLAGDDNLVSNAINEVEWYGGGRRVGGMRACCGCAWCGRVAAGSAPAIRLLRPHPAYTDLHRQVIATLQMVPFGNKRKRKNDELSMIMEPLTYEDAIAKYGIEFKQITAKDKNTQQKLSGLPREAYPERFPLSDVTSMLFCPSVRNHHKLAVATHAGLLFIINV